MSVLYLVLPASMLLALGAVLAFRWAARRGQFDDLDTPAWRAVMDDEPRRKLEESSPPTPT
ncbi:MAG: cbb3-type cytochrome oxidase assembly protein CcoS [Gemmatimonadaceae bacterium]|nr:cbb3-type cytochrome oxidase assembly protein CcoS [Gemmatimonadaceae bacterium]